jgi:hypothetical protein
MEAIFLTQYWAISEHRGVIIQRSVFFSFTGINLRKKSIFTVYGICYDVLKQLNVIKIRSDSLTVVILRV